MPIKSFIVPSCSWSLVSCRFYFRPSVQLDSHHLRSDANQYPTDQLSLRHSREKRYPFDY